MNYHVVVCYSNTFLITNTCFIISTGRGCTTTKVTINEIVGDILGFP